MSQTQKERMLAGLPYRANDPELKQIRAEIDTNVDYQYEILGHPDFITGNIDIEFIERRFMSKEAAQTQ